MVPGEGPRSRRSLNSPRPRSWWWRRRRPTRLVLSLASLLLGTTILAIPFAPWILYHTFKLEPSFPYATRLAGTNLLPNVSDAAKPLPAGNRLVIPKIGVDVEIIDGQDERALWRGIWRLPQTSSPDRGGNTVLTGHRFQYLAGPRTLYLLDQLVTGDLIIVYWKGAEYDYRVFGRRIVNPNAVEILNDTSKPQLTVFTCTPVFSTKQRLVLFAEPIVTAQPDYLTP